MPTSPRDDAYEKRFGASPDSTLRRSDALRQTSQLDASRTAYDSLLKTKLAARGYRGLGLLSGQAGQFDEAARQFARASDLEPTDALILSDLSYALLRAGAIDEARVPLMKASELARNNAKIQKNLVLYLLASGQTETARAHGAGDVLAGDAAHVRCQRAAGARCGAGSDYARSGESAGRGAGTAAFRMAARARCGEVGRRARETR